jgi:hypothetical protein
MIKIHTKNSKADFRTFKTTENFKVFEDLVAQTGNTYMFNDETSIKGSVILLNLIKEMGLNPMDTDELREGINLLFNIEVINMPDLENNRFILTPNHVSDFDAVVLGLLYPKIRIVSKNAWTNNKELRKFLDIHYDLYGFDRASVQSLRSLLRDAIDYFNKSSTSDENDENQNENDEKENKHYLIFSQGTISDFNHNSAERISTVAQKISGRTGVPIVNMFIEQVSIYEPTRIVFDEPMILGREDDFRKIWIEREKAMQEELIPAARLPVLSHKHKNNNKPGDPFF